MARVFVAEEGGRRRQRAVYLGASPELARRARALIRRHRERVRERKCLAREVEASCRFVAASAVLLRRLLRQGRSADAGLPWGP